MDLFFAGDPNMAPDGAFVFSDGFFEAGGDPFYAAFPGSDQFGPGPGFDDFGPGPGFNDFGPGPNGEFGPGPNGEFGPGPNGEFGPGPNGEFGPGPNGEFGPGPDGEFGPGPIAGGPNDFGPGPDGDFGPGPGPGFNDFGPGGGPGFNDFGPGPGPGFNDFGPGGGFKDFGPGGGFNDFGPGGGFNDFGPGGGFNDFGPGGGFNDFGPGGGFNDFGPGGGFSDPGFGFFDPNVGFFDPFLGFQDVIQDDQFQQIQEGEEFLNLDGGTLGTTLQRFTIHEGLPSQLVAIPTGQIQGPTIITLTSVSGDDSDLFTIDSGTGEITFASITPANAFNFEKPQDDGGDNIFNITLSITDGVNTTTQGHVFRIEDLRVLTGSDFENNFQDINPVFQSFGSQEAFVNAMTDGTLTWDPDFSGGALTFSGGSSAPTISLTDVVLLYKTLGHTVSLDMAGTFSGVDIGSNVFTSGTIAVDINDRSVSQFTNAGSFNFSSVASGSALTIVGGETLSLTATQSASGRDMSGASSISATDITTTVTNFTAGAQIGVGTGGPPLAASALIQITDVNGANGGGSVGLGVPAITDQQSGITDN
jgi:hypothetical protein